MIQASQFSHPQDFLTAFSHWRARFVVLLARFMTMRFRGSKFGVIVTLLEPLLWCWGLVLLRTLFRNAQPNFGTSLVLFYASGMFPYFLFMRISRRTVGITTNPFHRPAQITVLDMYLANAVVEMIIWTAVVVVLFYGMWLYGIDQARPASMSDCATPLLLLVMLGLGVGLINSTIDRFIPIWNRIYRVGTRVLMVGSGALSIVSLLPLPIRNIVVWNPVAHGVEWFRLGVYGYYPASTLDGFYLAKCAILALFLGLVANRATVRFARR